MVLIFAPGQDTFLDPLEGKKKKAINSLKPVVNLISSISYIITYYHTGEVNWILVGWEPPSRYNTYVVMIKYV